MKKHLIIGSRGSRLALKQATIVKERLEEKGLRVDILVIKTTGDIIKDSPLSKIGGKGVFVKEIEEALLAGDVDLAVHSMKDVPTELPSGLIIDAILKRTEYRDALISNTYKSLSDLPDGARVGTSSFRRTLQILRYHPNLKPVDIRGNVDTRLKKLDAGDYDAIVMSAVGLERLGLKKRISEYLNFLPAVGQGAMCIEVRESDDEVREIIFFLNDPISQQEVECERIFLKKMGGGCQVPLGAIAKIKGQAFFMEALIGSLDGKNILEHKVSGSLDDSKELATSLAVKLQILGGKEILENITHAPQKKEE